VIVTFKTIIGGRRNVTKTKTLLEYVKVFAADNIRQSGVNNNESSEYDSKNISLLVTPDQYNMCVQAQQMGQLSLALRRKDDSAIADAGTYDEDVLGELSASYSKSNDEELGESNPSSGDVNEFLDGQAQAHVAENPVPPVNAGPPQWTIKIYAGHEVREQKVDLAAEPAANGNSPSAPSAEADKNKHQGNKPGWLKSFFTGA